MRKKPPKRVKIRKTWKINPATRVHRGSKEYKRQNAKKELKKLLKRLRDEKDS